MRCYRGTPADFSVAFRCVLMCDPIVDFAKSLIRDGVREEELHELLHHPHLAIVPDPDKIRLQNVFRDLLQDYNYDKA